MAISIFTPIKSHIKHPHEKCAFLRGAGSFLSWGRKAYEIKPCNGSSTIELREVAGTKTTFGRVILRVLTIMTIVIPLFLLMAAYTYHSMNQFKIVPNEITPPKPSEAQFFKWNPHEIKDKYAKLVNKEEIQSHDKTEVIVIKNAGGAVNVGYEIMKNDPTAIVGVMIAANSGLPGGALGYRPSHITEEDIKIPTQEESIWANVVLTHCGTDPIKQWALHSESIYNKWGMIDDLGTMTKQGIDFTTTTDETDFNSCYIVNNCSVSAVDNQKKLVKDTAYPAVIVFADSVNANLDAGHSGGTMQRTFNIKALFCYDFFCTCIAQKLRSSLDAMISVGVTHPLIARLSCGIYAGEHKTKIKKDFKKILFAVLNEEVGPLGESRGSFFKKVIIPDFLK